MNYEKLIPEIWWDFFGRLIPGLVVLAQLYMLEWFSADIIEKWRALAILPAAYIIGHFLQPFGSRTEELISRYYRVTVEAEMKGCRNSKQKTPPATSRKWMEKIKICWGKIKTFFQSIAFFQLIYRQIQKFFT